jgi:glycosyltransferase involved in cell wall biosynthesis
MNPPTVPRAIHLVISLAHGGLERLVVDWTNVRNRQYPGSTAICCLDEAGELAAEVENGDVKALHARRSRFPFDLAAVLRLRRELRENGRCVLHSHNAAAWQYGTLACMGLPVRHVHTEHGSNPHFCGPINRLRNAWLWRRTDALVAVAASVAEDLLSRLRIPRGRIQVVPNGVRIPGPIGDGQPSTPDGLGEAETRRRQQDTRFGMRKDLGISADGVVIGSVGRLASVKGYDRLMRAFAAMRRETIQPVPCALLLVGDGPERSRLAELADALQVPHTVILAGYQPHPLPYVLAMDLFVLPSRSEGLSISLLEAMLAGVRVAATDVGANREILDGGRCGWLLPRDDEVWPAAMRDALGEPEASRMRCEAAKARVLANYSLDATLAAYERIYTLPPEP